MTQDTREIFSSHQLLRAKLGVFLQTPQKVELYASAAEAFFQKGNKEKLRFKLTWSWWAFFAQYWFFFFRKEYRLAVPLFIIGFFILDDKYYLLQHLAAMIFCALYAKFRVIKNFEKALDSDEDLKSLGGKNIWAIWMPILVGITTATSLGILFYDKY